MDLKIGDIQELLSEQSYNVEMRKHSFRAKLFAFFLPFLNNRLAVYKW